MKKDAVCTFPTVQVQTGRLPPKMDQAVAVTVLAKQVYVGPKWKIKAKEIDDLQVVVRSNYDNNNEQQQQPESGETTLVVLHAGTKTYSLFFPGTVDSDSTATLRPFLARLQTLVAKHQPEKQFADFLQTTSSPRKQQQRKRGAYRAINRGGGGISSSTQQPAASRRSYGTHAVKRKQIKVLALDIWGSEDEENMAPAITPGRHDNLNFSKKDTTAMDPVDDYDDDEDKELQEEQARISQALQGRRKRRLLKKVGSRMTLNDDNSDSEDDDMFDKGSFTTPAAAQRIVSPKASTSRTQHQELSTDDTEESSIEVDAAVPKDQPTISSFFQRRPKPTTATAKPLGTAAPVLPRTPERSAAPRSVTTPHSATPRSTAAARMVRSGKRALQTDNSWLLNSPAAKSPSVEHSTRLFGTDRPAWQLDDTDPIRDFSPTTGTARTPMSLQPRERVRAMFGTKQRVPLHDTGSLSMSRSPQLNLSRDLTAASSASTTNPLARYRASEDLADYTPKELLVRQGPTYRGLRNLGNTCYLNASLQMLYTLKDFTGALQTCVNNMAITVIDPDTVPLTRNICAVALELADTSTTMAVNPRSVKSAMDKKTDKFVGFEQRDAHEFLSDLVDNIHDELEASDKKKTTTDAKTVVEPADSSIVNPGDKTVAPHQALPADDFCLTVRVCLKCNSCGYSRAKEEIYRHLSIDIVSEKTQNGADLKCSVEQSLERFFQPETREIKCEKCEDGVDASQTIKILSRPKALLLHLKRFIVEEKIKSSPEASDENSQPNSPKQVPSYELVFKKNKAPVRIPPKLSLDSFRVEPDTAEEPTMDAAASVGGGSRSEYSLKSVAHHLGSRASSGHYTAEAVRMVEKDTSTTDKRETEEKWFIFDDGKVHDTSLESVTTTVNKQRTAYMLLYTMNEDKQIVA